MEDDDWMNAASEDAPAEEAAPAESAPAVLDDEEEAIEELDLEPEGPSRPQRERSDRLVLYRHWIRPKFLQYAYMYDYRHNYYDDVIDFLDRRQKGLTRDIPRAQTWAERALRTYAAKSREQTAAYERKTADLELLSNMRSSARFYRYHSKDYITTKYSKFLL